MLYRFLIRKGGTYKYVRLQTRVLDQMQTKGNHKLGISQIVYGQTHKGN